MFDADVIVIGSGAGGLGAGLGLALAGQRVLVIEQHEVPGGYCQSFYRGGFRFSPGLHYVGDLHPGGVLRRLLEGLGVSADFFELNPDGYDRCIISGTRFAYCAGREALAARFADAFPHEAAGAARVLQTVDDAYQRLLGAFESKRIDELQRMDARTSAAFGAPIMRLVRQWVRDPLCASFLTMQHPNHGMPPQRAPVAIHATVQGHYLHGGWYPRGGGAGLVKAMLRSFKALGGQLMLRTPVERVLVDNGRALGVRLADGRELRSRLVVSNADPRVTWSRLVGEENTPPALRQKLTRLRWSSSTVCMFLVVDVDPRRFGLDSGNSWWMSARADPRAEPGDDGVFVAVSTLKDPTHFDGRHHVVDVISQAAWRGFAAWENSTADARPEAYVQRKAEIARKLLQGVERLAPGLTAHIIDQDLATPLTNLHYVGATQGAAYGIEKSADQIGQHSLMVSGDLDGLLQCGASTVGHGVVGSLLSGVAAAAAALDVTLGEVLSARGGVVRTFLAEDASTWPADVQDAVLRRQGVQARSRLP